jgi:4-alpha-glucanotransferase
LPPVNERDWGVQTHYDDASGSLRAVPQATLRRVLHALEANGSPPPADTLSVAPGTGARVEGAVEILTEDGRTVACDGAVPADLPEGYHHIVDRLGRAKQLIVSPRRCTLPGRARSFGFAVQLYAARSRRSWGIGDLGDLHALAAWSEALGASLLLLNPLHAPVTAAGPSPYSAGSRRYRNPLYLDIDQVPGIDRVETEVASLRADIRRLNDDRLIHRDRVHRMKRSVLEALWEQVGDVPELDGFIAADPGVVEYATFCSMAEEYGESWRAWPEGVRHPHAAGVHRFRRDHARRIRFHVWLQWLLEVQLARASQRIGLVHDLAVGFDPEGAEAWEWQDVVVDDFELGAPPDTFNARGQRWGLAPLDPWRVQAAEYAPVIQTLRAAFRSAAGVRLDHVMGLFRLFWIPRDAPADDGAYVSYPSDVLLDILALESSRARAFVVGEDLGLVAPGVRETLTARDVLLYRLLWFDQDPAGYPVKSLCGVTTHDLPTVVGMWYGADVASQERIGLQPNTAMYAAIQRRIAEAASLDERASRRDVVQAVYRLLRAAPSQVRTATLDDMALAAERPNIPGTVDTWPNWSLALPQPLEEIMDSSLPRTVAAELRDA